MMNQSLPSLMIRRPLAGTSGGRRSPDWSPAQAPGASGGRRSPDRSPAQAPGASGGRRSPGLILVLAGVLLISGCTRAAPLDRPYEDDFNRESPGKDWFDTIGRYIIDRGALYISGGYNHPLWLTRPLPAEVEITLDARGLSPDGDLKIELFGDGRSFAFNRGRYWSTGYVLCQGGWNNTKTFIARRDEHDRALLHSTRFPVTLEKWHHWRIQTFLENGRLTLEGESRELAENPRIKSAYLGM